LDEKRAIRTSGVFIIVAVGDLSRIAGNPEAISKRGSGNSPLSLTFKNLQYLWLPNQLKSRRKIPETSVFDIHY
jgi:hypothetical protein